MFKSNCLIWETYLVPPFLLCGHYFLVVQWGQTHLNEQYSLINYIFVKLGHMHMESHSTVLSDSPRSPLSPLRPSRPSRPGAPLCPGSPGIPGCPQTQPLLGISSCAAHLTIRSRIKKMHINHSCIAPDKKKNDQIKSKSFRLSKDMQTCSNCPKKI